ncbi:MAG: hypothetical protein ACRC8S_01150 [Fimbriiglobus sp.]
MPDEKNTPETAGPDHFFVGGGVVDWQNRLPDGGPRYAETPVNPYLAEAGRIAEPWNTVTASFFVFIVGYWLWRVGRRWRQYPFVISCLPILLAGGIGGTLYHATRTQRAYFLLDVIPISLLGFAGAVYLVVRLASSLGVIKVLSVTLGLLLTYLAVNGLLFQAIRFENPNMRVNLSYASLAVIILIPVAAVLVRTRFRYGAFVGTALVSFAIAWLCRLVDNTGISELPMGTHWLWHSFGALTTQLMIVYFAKLAETELK